MKIPVWVERTNGKYTASVPGLPSISVSGATREAAIDEARSQIRSGMTDGKLVLSRCRVRWRLGARRDLQGRSFHP